MRTPVPAHVRIMARVEMVTESGCWIYIGALDPKGYARVGVGSTLDGTARLEMAHRVIYEHYRGPIPAGLTLDHVKARCLCRACVNPWHTEPVTNVENVMRSDGAGARHARQTECPKCGGPYVSVGRQRICRPCTRAYSGPESR